MTLPVRMRELLACPKCHGTLDDAMPGPALECPRCRLRFPIRDGIPVMLLELAERLDV